MENYSDIFDAIKSGDLEAVKKCWTKDINIDYQDEKGMNFVMLAAKHNHKEVVNHLLTLNPNLYLSNKEKETVFQISERLEGKEIFTTLVESCWNEGEQIFLFEYHGTPNFKTAYLGAFVNCWVMDKDFNTAKLRSKSLVETANWEIEAIEDISEIKRDSIDKKEDIYNYYEQVIIDKEVLVFYTYDEMEEE
jgi:hypothetical protein